MTQRSGTSVRSFRLFVACAGAWRGYFPLAGDVVWNPTDAAAPYALIFDPRRWTPIAAVPAPPFRGWRYLESPPGGDVAASRTAQSLKNMRD